MRRERILWYFAIEQLCFRDLLVALRELPRHAHDLSLTVCPEVDGNANQVVDGRIGTLVQQNGSEDTDRVDGEPSSNASVECGVGDQERQRVFPSQTEETEQDVEYLEGGERLDSRVERFCPCVPEDLWPEDTMQTSCNLVRSGGHDDETGEVVLDEFSHFEVFFCMCFCFSSVFRVIFRVYDCTGH